MFSYGYEDFDVSRIAQPWIPPASLSPLYHVGSMFFQVGVFSYPASRDSTSVLQQLCCPGAFLFNKGMGDKEGAGFYKLCGSVSGCGRGACTSMPAGWNHQDGVQGDSVDVPFWCCECMLHEVIVVNHLVFSYAITCFTFIFSSTGSVFQSSNERRRNHPQWTEKEICRDLNVDVIYNIWCFVKISTYTPIMSALFWIITVLRWSALQWITVLKK